MIGIPLGLLTANAIEWKMHQILHSRGRNRTSIFAFHFHEHHRNVRKHQYYDPSYERFPLGWHAQGKELALLAAGGLAVAPLFPVAPFFVGTLWYSAANYYYVHKRSHNDPEWGKQHVPWHYDHHMGPNPNANWCVTKPWFDNWMGTRERYLGATKQRTITEDEEALAEAS